MIYNIILDNKWCLLSWKKKVFQHHNFNNWKGIQYFFDWIIRNDVSRWWKYILMFIQVKINGKTISKYMFNNKSLKLIYRIIFIRKLVKFNSL